METRSRRPSSSIRRRRQRAAVRRSPRIALLAIGVVAAGLIGLHGTAYGGSPASVHTVRVHGGDSLWSIAERVYGTDDIRDRVDAIVEVNHLQGGTVEPGQELIVPAP